MLMMRTTQPTQDRHRQQTAQHTKHATGQHGDALFSSRDMEIRIEVVLNTASVEGYGVCCTAMDP